MSGANCGAPESDSATAKVRPVECACAGASEARRDRVPGNGRLRRAQSSTGVLKIITRLMLMTVTTMDGFMAFCLAYPVATATPGPAVAASVTPVHSNGGRRGVGFMEGVGVGVLVWFTLECTGMARMWGRGPLRLLIFK